MRLSVIQKKKRTRLKQKYELEGTLPELSTGTLIKETAKTCLKEFWPDEWNKRLMLAGSIACSIVSPVAAVKATYMQKRIADKTAQFMLHATLPEGGTIDCNCQGKISSCKSFTKFKRALISDSCKMIGYLLAASISIGISKELLKMGKKELAKPRLSEALDVLAEFEEEEKLTREETSALANIAIMQVRGHHQLNSKLLTKYIPVYLEAFLSAAAISNVSAVPAPILLAMFTLMGGALTYTGYLSVKHHDEQWQLQDSIANVLSMTEEYFYSRGELSRWNLRGIQKAQIMKAYQRYRELLSAHSSEMKSVKTTTMLYFSEIIVYLMLLGKLELVDVPGNMTLVHKMFKVSHKAIKQTSEMLDDVPALFDAEFNVQRLLALKHHDDGGEDAPSGGALKFENVCACDPFGKRIVGPLSFNLEQHRAALIVGGSGSGKSVISCLAQSLVKPSEGLVLYSGQPIDTFSQSSLCREILNCSPGQFLLSKSMLDFISYGIENFDSYRAMIYMEEMCLEEMIPEVFDKQCEPSHYSELPKYKIAILCVLRALCCKQASVVVFDSVLDNVGEDYFFNIGMGLDMLSQRCAVLVLSSTDLSDKYKFSSVIRL